MTTHIIGAGLVGCVLANVLDDNCILYEREEIGGACVDNENYQKYVHIMHTDYDDVWEFVSSRTDIKPHQTVLKSYVDGELWDWYPKELTELVWEKQVRGYSKKQWLDEPPMEARQRIKTDPDGKVFRDKYEGVVNYTKLFDSLTKDKTVIKMNVRHGDLPEKDKIILTGAVDEYFHYCYGELPYRGMKSVHYQSETRLLADYYTFNDEKIPFQRIIDYDRLGYKGGWIGIEIATGDEKHYPVRDDNSIALYNKYVELASQHNIGLVGRLATYRYIDSDDAIRQALDYAKQQ